MSQTNSKEEKKALEDTKLTKDEYYNDNQFCNWSGLRCYSKCPNLYKEKYIEKKFEESEKDYFKVGKLVDAMLTEDNDYIEENFMRVKRTPKPEKLLSYEEKVKKAKEEKKKYEKKDTKRSEKSVKKRKKTIKKYQKKIDKIKEAEKKCVLTRSKWDKAEETATAIKTHPYYNTLEFNDFTSQQILITEVQDVACKGRLDHLKLSPKIREKYKLFVGGSINYEELMEHCWNLDNDEKWAVITDIKTCYDLSKIDLTKYRGQLSFYQNLVASFFIIPESEIDCNILVGDKVSSKFKKSELLTYTQPALEQIKRDTYQWMKMWNKSIEEDNFPSAKEKYGTEQECFKCTECRFSPFSANPGDPVVIDMNYINNN